NKAVLSFFHAIKYESYIKITCISGLMGLGGGKVKSCGRVNALIVAMFSYLHKLKKQSLINVQCG
ncbi:MAG: hypothetical protein RM049_19835, partial [Nostoc sp. DedQUE04]|uniref:hypothetical protein n=1 Tax=Nostoc sp. DedQUE04 TaxID=3075390 RepID=UPI002AD4535E